MTKQNSMDKKMEIIKWITLVGNILLVAAAIIFAVEAFIDPANSFIYKPVTGGQLLFILFSAYVFFKVNRK